MDRTSWLVAWNSPSILCLVVEVPTRTPHPSIGFHRPAKRENCEEGAPVLDGTFYGKITGNHGFFMKLFGVSAVSCHFSLQEMAWKTPERWAPCSYGHPDGITKNANKTGGYSTNPLIVIPYMWTLVIYGGYSNPKLVDTPHWFFISGGTWVAPKS